MKGRNKMENLIRVDFGTNRVEKTRYEWTNKLIQQQINSLDTIDNNDSFIAYLLRTGFQGYDNYELEELIDEIYDTLGHEYDIENKGTLYEIQPDDLEPIEFTHFDQWFCDEKEDGTQEQYATRANEILKAWEQTLNIKLPRPNFLKDGLSLGFEIVCEAIVNAGFSVYNGDEFIEIYSEGVTQ
jgi:hypothetical protein